MKKLLLPVVFCLFSTLVEAQVETIEFDFASPGTPPKVSKTDIKKGDFYIVKVKGLNLNLYKVSMSAVDTILSKPQQTPAFGNFQLDALSKLAAGISPLSTILTINQPMMLDLTQSVSTLKGRASFTATTKAAAANTTIIARMQQEKIDLEASKGRIEALGKRIDDLKMAVYKLRLTALKTVPDAGTFDFDAALIEIEDIRKLLSAEKGIMTLAQKNYEGFSTLNKSAIEAAADLKENDKSIKEAYDKIVTLLTEAVASVSADKSQELLAPLIAIQNNKDAIFTSMPQQFTGEQSKVTLTVSPRDEKFNLNSYSTQYTFPIRIKKYVSVGISFYGASLHDEAYSTLKAKAPDSTTTDSYSLKKEDNHKAELGIAALLRFGTKYWDNRDIGTHLSLGAGISVSNKIKPRMLFGGGFSFGDKHMLTIDAGGILGYVDRLSNVVSESATYSEKPESVVVSKIGFGGFLSIGYLYQF